MGFGKIRCLGLIEEGVLSRVCHLHFNVSPCHDEVVENDSVLGIAVVVVVVVEETRHPLDRIELVAYRFADIRGAFDPSAVLEVHVECHAETRLPCGHLVGQLFGFFKCLDWQEPHSPSFGGEDRGL